MWLSLAIERGLDTTEREGEGLSELEAEMAAEDTARAKQLALEWSQEFGQTPTRP